MAIPDLEIFWFWIDHRLRDIDFFLGKKCDRMFVKCANVYDMKWNIRIEIIFYFVDKSLIW